MSPIHLVTHRRLQELVVTPKIKLKTLHLFFNNIILSVPALKANEIF